MFTEPVASRSNYRRAFTLVELVVVVLIIGILSAVAAPKLFNTSQTARESGTRHSLSVLRDAIELYKAQNGSYPAATSLTTSIQPYHKGPFPAIQIGSKSNTVVASTANPLAVVAGGAGWVYNETTGDISVNDSAGIPW